MIRSVDEFVTLRASADPTEQRRAKTEPATEEVWREVIDRFPEMRQWVARNTTVSAAILGRLARDPDPSVRWHVAMSNRAPVGVLRELAVDPDESVRARIARHRRTPPDVRNALLRDSSPLIREEAAAEQDRR